MKKEIKEMKLRLKKLEQIILENYYIVKRLREFLNNYQNEFRNKDSLKALRKIAIYLEPREKEYESANEEYKKIEEKLQGICNHELVIKDIHELYYCPICNECFYHSEPDDSFYSSTIYSSTRFIIETKDRKAKFVSKIVDEALICEGDFLENIRNRLEEIQYESNVKVMRR